jgi:hypothetical protein
MRDVFDDVAKRTDAQIKKWDALVKTDVAAFDKLVRSSGLPAVGAGKTKRAVRAVPQSRSRARAAAATTRS